MDAHNLNILTAIVVNERKVKESPMSKEKIRKNANFERDFSFMLKTNGRIK